LIKDLVLGGMALYLGRGAIQRHRAKRASNEFSRRLSDNPHVNALDLMKHRCKTHMDRLERLAVEFAEHRKWAQDRDDEMNEKIAELKALIARIQGWMNGQK
jgi:hypothetical protein